MKSLLLSVLVLLSIALSAPAQADSSPKGVIAALRLALAQARSDSARGRLTCELGRLITHGDSAVYFEQQAIAYLQRTLPLARGAERLRLLRLLGGAVDILGSEYAFKNDPRSQPYHLRALSLYQQAGYVRGQIISLYNMAILRAQKEQSSDYAGALVYLQQAVRLGEHVPAARSMVATCLSVMGYIDGKLGNKKAELTDMLQAQTMLEQSKEATPLIQNLNLLSQAYLEDYGDTARAEVYARRAQEVATQTAGANIGLSTALLQRGMIRAKQHRLLAARAFFTEALRHADIIQRRVEIYTQLVLVEEQAGNLPLALRYANRSLAYAKGEGLEGKSGVEQALARLYEKLGQPQQALTHFHSYIVLRDSLRSENRQKAGYRQQMSYDYERKEAALKAAQEKRQAVATAEIRRQKQLRLATTTGASLLLLLAGGLYYAFRRAERLKRLVINQKLDLQTQRDQLNSSLTDLRQTQAQLIQKEKMASLGELTAGIAHEIQNPLNFVNNFADVSAELVAELQEAQAAGDQEEVTALVSDLAQNLGRISQHGQRAAGIVRGMLEHSRTSTGERTAVDVNALCQEYLRLAYHGLRAKDKAFNAELVTTFTPALPLVEGVGPDLGRVLLNLFNNAFYAVQQRQQAGEAGYQPTVSVRTKQVGSTVEMQVADNGTGMSAAVQAKVFQPFFTTKPTGEGTGLGLSLAHDIIAQGHGGTLHVESALGQGTTFTITLPRAVST